MERVVIIGNGIAGVTCARHVRKYSDASILLISSETQHFFSRPALMYIFMGHLEYKHTKPYEDSFWKKNRIELCLDHVEAIQPQEKSLQLRSGKTLSYDQLVIATGSQSRWMDWPGNDLKGVQGLYSYPDMELMQKNTRNIRHAVVVGGGLIGIEVAEMLHYVGAHVTFLVREKGFWNNVIPMEEARLIGKHIVEKHHVDLRLETELKAIQGNEDGRVVAIRTHHDEDIACDFLAITIGVQPCLEGLKDSGIDTNRGVLVDEYLRTNMADVYAIGDCAELRQALPHRRILEPVWYTGRMMGECVARTLTGTPTPYVPQIWFNSAKFFDIEYQIYGQVSPRPAEEEAQVYWENAEDEKCMRISFSKPSGAVLGCQVFGIRQRHEVWDQWIREACPLAEVLDRLEEANFDPEFFRHYETSIQQAFAAQVSPQLSNMAKA